MEQNYPGGRRQYSGNAEKLRAMFNQNIQQQAKPSQQYHQTINYTGSLIYLIFSSKKT